MTISNNPEVNGSIKIVVEKHEDGYVAYPVGMKGVVVSEGETYEQAVAEVKSAIRFHMETFGPGERDYRSCLSTSSK